MCQQPLFEILKIMDKKDFEYDLDLGPTNHVYYYITATLYCLNSSGVIDFSKALHYLINVMIIIYKNSEMFEMIPKQFYEAIFDIIEAIHTNHNRTQYSREQKKNYLADLLNLDKDKEQKRNRDVKLSVYIYILYVER